LGEGRVLFVLDNFEQVIDAAPVLPEMLAARRACGFLVSSRTASARLTASRSSPSPGLTDATRTRRGCPSWSG
jgi:hypothetical protein